MKQFEFSSILGWSVSRYDLFKTCKRQYYYNYYGKHDKEFPVEKILYLKKLTSIPLEVGNIYHDILETLLKRLQKSEKPIDWNKFNQFLYKMTYDYCSRKDFNETYYKQSEQIDVQAIYKKAKTCLNNFIKSERFSWLLKEATRFKKGWVIEPPGFGETRLNGLKAYCKVDFLFPWKDNLIIIDWKTGKQHEAKHKKQLLGYTAWASYHYEKPADQIEAIAVYLHPEYKEYQVTFKEKDLEDFALSIKAETEEMYQYCLDIEENIPLDKENFPLTDNRFFCNYCSYRELCFSSGKE